MIIGGYLIGSSEGDGNWGVYPDHHPDQHDLLFLPSNTDIVLSATDGGVFKSADTFADTVTWTSLNNGYYTSQLYGVSISRNANSEVMHGGFQDNGNFITFSDDVQTHWNMPFNGDGAFGGIADNEEDFYLTIQRGVMYKMKLDTNANRLAFNRMDPASIDSNDYMFINPMVMDENSDIIYIAAKNKLWRNNDVANIPYNNSHAKNDFGWEMLSDTFPNYALKISTIEPSVSPANVVYLGTQNKYIYRIDNANVGDPAVVQLPNIPIASNAYCSDIAVNPNNADELMVIYSNYSVYSVFHSIDGGQSWEKVAGNLEQSPSGSGNGPSCRTAKIIPLGNDTLYLVGTSVGLFGTDNLDGQNTVWKQVASQEIGAVVIETLTYRANDGLLVVGTHGNGIFQTNLTSANGVLSGIENVLVNNFEMNIYPNPVTSIVNVEFTLKTNSKVSLHVYDELGKLVKVVKQNKYNKGDNKIQLAIDNLKSGIYFVSLKVDGELFTKQIVKK